MDSIILIILIYAVPCSIGLLIANYIFDKYFTWRNRLDKILNKPFRLPKGSKKKFGVYVKKGGKIIKVTFGDPNMDIKRDSPERRAAFRARHGCDGAKDKTSPKYWSCRMWTSKPVSEIAK